MNKGQKSAGQKDSRFITMQRIAGQKELSFGLPRRLVFSAPGAPPQAGFLRARGPSARFDYFLL